MFYARWAIKQLQFNRRIHVFPMTLDVLNESLPRSGYGIIGKSIQIAFISPKGIKEVTPDALRARIIFGVSCFIILYAR